MTTTKLDSTSSDDDTDSGYEEGIGLVKLKEMTDEKPYLQTEQLEGGDLRLSLFIPPYNINDLQEGYKEKLTMFFNKRKLDQMER